jgi:hypothetical protein
MRAAIVAGENIGLGSDQKDLFTRGPENSTVAGLEFRKRDRLGPIRWRRFIAVGFKGVLFSVRHDPSSLCSMRECHDFLLNQEKTL